MVEVGAPDFKQRAIVDGVAMTGMDRFLRKAPGGYLPVFREIGVDPAIVGTPGTTTLFRNYMAYFEVGAKHANDPAFGLRYGALTRPHLTGIPGYAILSSMNLRDAMINFALTIPVIVEGLDLWLVEDEDTAYYQWLIVEERNEAHWQFAEFVNAFLLSMFRGIMGRRWKPREVHYRHPPPGDVKQFSRVFEAPVYFGRPVNALVVDRSDLNKHNLRADPNLRKLLLHQAETQLAHRLRPTDPLRVVRTTISQALSQGMNDITFIAERLNMSARALQRLLTSHGTTFRHMLEDVRFELAREFLGDPTLPMNEIAYRLGYAEVSAFSRAFSRWAGVSPKHYR